MSHYGEDLMQQVTSLQLIVEKQKETIRKLREKILEGGIPQKESSKRKLKSV